LNGTKTQTKCLTFTHHCHGQQYVNSNNFDGIELFGACLKCGNQVVTRRQSKRIFLWASEYFLIQGYKTLITLPSKKSIFFWFGGFLCFGFL